MALIGINLATNPRIGTSLANYGGEASAETPGVSIVGASPYPSVHNGARVVGTKTNSYLGVTYLHTGVTPGQAYSFSATMDSDSGSPVTGYLVYVLWQDSAGGSIVGVTGPTAAWNNGVFVRVKYENVVAPAGAARALVSFRKVGSTGAGSFTDVSAVMINAGTTALAYFDGASLPGGDNSYGWTGTADASSSQWVTMGPPSLILYDDDTLGPRVEALFQDLLLGTQTINVYRTAEGRTMKVRGGVNLYAVGGAAVLDPEVPFGIPVIYQAEQFTAAGVSLGMTDAATIQVDTTDTWISQPLAPASAVQVRVRTGSTGSLVRPSPGAIVYPEGGTVGRVISGQRTGVQGATIVLSVDEADADAFDALWGGYSVDYPAVVCLRTPPNVPLPAVLFFGCVQPERQSSGANFAIRYSLQGSEVAPPAPGLVVPALRRDDIDAAFATRAGRAAAYATRIARDTDYTKAGLAG